MSLAVLVLLGCADGEAVTAFWQSVFLFLAMVRLNYFASVAPLSSPGPTSFSSHPLFLILGLVKASALPLLLFIELQNRAVDASQASGLQGFESKHLISALPSPPSDRLWVRVRQPIDLPTLAGQLRMSASSLASLNAVDDQHRFRQGDWLVLPSQQGHYAKQLAALDTSQMRRTPPPLQAPPPVQARKEMTSADIAAEIYRRRWAGFVAIGSCKYDWSGWKLNSRGTRSTRYRCDSDDYQRDQWIAVDCKSLKVANSYYGVSWSQWRYPSDDDEVSMVARLCANTLDRAAKAERRKGVVSAIPGLEGVVQPPGRPAGGVFKVNGAFASAGIGELIGNTKWRLVSARGSVATISDGIQVFHLSVGCYPPDSLRCQLEALDALSEGKE